jgi:hypothetical protein
MVIPGNVKLQEEILHELQDSRAFAHLGQKKTTKKVARYFWWPGMSDLHQAIHTALPCMSGHEGGT